MVFIKENQNKIAQQMFNNPSYLFRWPIFLNDFNSTQGCSPIMCKFIAPCTKFNPWTRLRPMPFSPTTQNAFDYARFTYTKSAEGTFTTIIAFQYVFEVFDCNVINIYSI